MISIDLSTPSATPPVEARRAQPSAAEHAIVEAVRNFQTGRDREASFRILFDRFHHQVEVFFARRVATPEESLDLTQETFLRAYRGLDGFGGRSPFGAWLFRIARNVLHTSAARARTSWAWGRQVEWDERSQARVDRADRDGRGLQIDEPQPTASLIHRERLETLRRAISDLPPQRRRCIVLWAYHELSYREIAVVLRLSIGTVKAHLAQARQQLEERLVESPTEVGHD